MDNLSIEQCKRLNDAGYPQQGAHLYCCRGYASPNSDEMIAYLQRQWPGMNRMFAIDYENDVRCIDGKGRTGKVEVHAGFPEAANNLPTCSPVAWGNTLADALCELICTLAQEAK